MVAAADEFALVSFQHAGGIDAVDLLGINAVLTHMRQVMFGPSKLGHGVLEDQLCSFEGQLRDLKDLASLAQMQDNDAASPGLLPASSAQLAILPRLQDYDTVNSGCRPTKSAQLVMSPSRIQGYGAVTPGPSPGNAFSNSLKAQSLGDCFFNQQVVQPLGRIPGAAKSASSATPHSADNSSLAVKPSDAMIDPAREQGSCRGALQPRSPNKQSHGSIPALVADPFTVPVAVPSPVNAGPATGGKFRPTFKASSLKGKVVCPVCSDETVKLHMHVHILRFHRDRYQNIYGVPPPLPTPCDICHQDYTLAAQLADHKLSVHGVEDPQKLTDIPSVTRMTVMMLSFKFFEAAQHLNAIIRHVVELEAAIVQVDPSYVSMHGVEITTMWYEDGALEESATGKTAIAAIQATASLRKPNLAHARSHYIGEQLIRLRIIAGRRGRLLDGGSGTYGQIVAELENRLRYLSDAHGDNGDDNQQMPNAEACDDNDFVPWKEDDIYSAD